MNQTAPSADTVVYDHTIYQRPGPLEEAGLGDQ